MKFKQKYKDEDLIGKKFGRLTVLNILKKKENSVSWKMRYAHCKCSCGTEKDVRLSSLVRGAIKSCGCYNSECSRIRGSLRVKHKDEDLIGKKFGRLTVVNIIIKNGYRYAHCECDCGNDKDVAICSLVKGKSTSCGCYNKEFNSKLHSIHKNSKCDPYIILHKMKERCYNPKCKQYEYYGGRGIKLCDAWLKDPMNFVTWSFENGWKKELTIDRIDTNGDYSPDNCRWVNRHIQSANRGLCTSNKSGYSGVYFNKARHRFISGVTVNKKHYHLGSFKSKKDALEARNRFIIENNLSEYPIQEWKGE